MSQGAPQDQYATSVDYIEGAVGTKTPSAGNHTFKLTVTGKRSASTSFYLNVDSITLAP